jgi:O-6-methylguanine DNA methyltransferase
MPTSKKPSVFSNNVRRVVKAIPKGQTKSYKEVAAIAGNSKAARAVAKIMANNYDLEVPCHRVIKSDGNLGGYNRGGEAVKHAILESEKH